MIKFGYDDFAAIGGSLFLCLAIFVADTLFPLGTAIWVAYLLPLVISFFSRRVWLPPAICLLSIVAMLAGFLLAGSGIDPQVAATNRSLAAAVMLILSAVGVGTIRNRERIAAADWVQTGEIATAHELQGDLTAEDIGQRTLATLGRLLDARAGLLYACAGQDFRPLAAWGVAPESGARERDRSHLARAVRERRIVEITGSREEAPAWGSGLMRGRAAHVAILPAGEHDSVNAVLEFGLSKPLSATERRLLDRLSERIGVALRSAAYRDELQALLEETRRQAEELRTHTEELAATNEELEEQTRALQESQRRLTAQQAELEEQNAQLESQTQQLEEQRDAIAASRRRLLEQAEELESQSRYKSEFVANMSHELRTPLNALLIMARLLRENRGGSLTEEQLRWAETIESSGQDLLTLINDILDLSKIEAGQMDVAIAAVSPGALATKLMRAFEMQAQSKGIGLEIEVAPGLGDVQTDAVRLEQILRNFLSNAIKFTERGRVVLSIRRDREGIAFAVRDTGIGIAPDQQATVFEAFRQADGTISRRFGGTGLGLSISRDLAELLGGAIALQSTPGQGSTFTLTLPVTPDAVRPADRAPGVLPSAGVVLTAPAAAEEDGFGALAGVQDDRATLTDGARLLLVVEDDPAFARVILDLAHELAFKALVVGTATDAVAAARRHRPHGIILDIGLPDHSGLSVLDRLKRDVDTRHIPIHVVSAQDYTREALAQGAMSYLMKPVERDALTRALQRLEPRMRRVLIVEDDPAQLEGLKALLATEEVETVGVSTAAEALAACRESTFDCIVLDMTLPDASGFDLLERLDEDETASFPPVIVYTARALSEAEELRLRRYSRSIIIKGAKSPERLIDEVTLFLHQVVSDLPLRQREMLAASLNRDALLEGRRILVVEDDVRNVYALTGVFEPHGVEVLIARNGREALETLGRAADGGGPRVDLVLMDVMMPEMDGLTATREIRKIARWKALPIIMLTAKAMADDQSQCIAAGANDYLPKPIDVDKLLSLTRVWMPR